MLLIDDLSVRVAGRLLIDHASVQLPTGSRVGLVGRNGAGKTTLFRVIAGDLSPEHGAVRKGSRERVGRLAQEAPDGPQSLLDTVLVADAERASLLAEAESVDDPHRIAEIQTRLADIEAHSAPARAAAILSGLGFSAAELDGPCAEFSGGWRMRVALAAALFSAPDILLLDEPTNYLDLEGTLWLQDHLARYPRTVIVISHDRDLLDNAVDAILHLDRGKLTFYRGGYSSFERQRRERQVLDQKAAKTQEAERQRLQAFFDRFRAKASKARQAQSRLKVLAKLGPINAVADEAVRPIVIPPPATTLSPPIIALDDVAVGYVPDRPVLDRLTLRIDTEDRIALLGQNGNGKSTLSKLLAARLAPAAGRIVRADRLGVAYFAQHQLDELSADESPYDHVRRRMVAAPESRVRAKVGAMGFPGDAANVPVHKLSGGEKARLLLGLAAFAGPHLLILDEPTNHLDIDSRAALVEAINDYPGAVILVSHDRFLLDACAERLWLVADGTVTPFDGDLDDYRRAILSGRGETANVSLRSTGSEPRSGRAAGRRNAAERRAELSPLRARIAAAEAAMRRWSEEIARIDKHLSAPDLFARDPAGAAELTRTRSASVQGLAEAEEEWLKASSAYEAASA